MKSKCEMSRPHPWPQELSDGWMLFALGQTRQGYFFIQPLIAGDNEEQIEVRR